MVKMFVSHPNNTWDLVNIKLCDTKTHGRATMMKMFVSHPNILGIMSIEHALQHFSTIVFVSCIGSPDPRKAPVSAFL